MPPLLHSENITVTTSPIIESLTQRFDAAHQKMGPPLSGEVYDAAAKIIERDGWCQGSMHMYDYDRNLQQHCLLGAVETAAEETMGCTPWMFQPNILEPLYKATSQNPAEWNDRRLRTKQDVIDALHRAADYARERDER